MFVKTMSWRTRLGAQSGASLIEVLVSVLVISFGILGMAGLQANSIKFHKTSEYRATATLLLADIADRMRANADASGTGSGARANAYTWATTGYTALTPSTLGSLPSCGGYTAGANGAAGAFTACTDAQLAAMDLYEWKNRLLLSLPGASGHIANYDATTQTIDLWLAWQDPEEKDQSGASIAVTSPQCPGSAIWSTSTSTYHCLFMRVAL